MDFLTSSPSTSSLSSSSAVGTTTTATNGTWSSSGVGVGRGRGSFTASQMVGRIICAIFTCAFAMVGSFVGAITGALIGLATESGLFRGAGIGSISGAVFSIEVVESSVSLWRSNRSVVWSVLYMIDIVTGLLSGRLVREKVGPAVQSRMSVVDSPFIEALDIFDTGGTKGMPKESVNNLRQIMITTENNVDASGDRICYSVCLQDFQIEETVRSFPHCEHIFHLPCIDGWLISHGSCPLCRRDL